MSSHSSERYVQLYRADGSLVVGGLIEVNPPPPKPQVAPQVVNTTTNQPREESWIHVERRRHRKWKGTSD